MRYAVTQRISDVKRQRHLDSSPFQEAEAETQQLEEQLQEALRRRHSAAGLQMW
jgi:hypothetical protein